MRDERGVAFILVLWVLVLLMTLGTEFALSMKTEVNTTRNFKEDLESYYLAKAGINLAKAEISGAAGFHSGTDEHGFIFGPQINVSDSDAEFDDELSLPEPPVRTDLPLGRGFVHYSIKDENGKINLNKVSRDVLIKALAKNGMSPGTERDTVADSILDWIDEDDRHRLNGAESDYYKRLSPPYSAKNGPLDSIEELLKIRGVTPELVYGSPDYNPQAPSGFKIHPGLARIFTVYNVTQFNPNTAERVVLEIMFPEDIAEDILDTKKERGWYNFAKSTHFRVEAKGTLEHSPTRHTVVAVFERTDAGGRVNLLTRYWNDNFIRR